jgi:hypothetical protein
MYNKLCKDVNGTCGAGSMASGTMYDELAFQSMTDQTVGPAMPPHYPVDPLAALNYLHSDQYTPLPASECAYGYTENCIPKSKINKIDLIYFDWWSSAKENAGLCEVYMDENNVVWDLFTAMKYPGYAEVAWVLRIFNIFYLVDKKFEADGTVVPDVGCNTTVYEMGPEHGELMLWFQRQCSSEATVDGNKYTHSGYYKFLGDSFALAYRMSVASGGVTPEMYATNAYKWHTPETKASISYQAPLPPFGGLSDLLCDECTLCVNKCRFSPETNATYRAWQVPYLYHG